LDGDDEAAWIGGQFYTMAGTSRGDKARTLTQEQYRAWQWKEVAKLGIDPPADPSGDQRLTG
jgi:hypothetical protein